jgi:hypothetical protein
MGLTMKQKQALTATLAPRYRQSGRKTKSKILDEFTAATGYNRKYALHLLSGWGKETFLMVDGKPGEFCLTLTATDVASGWTELRFRGLRQAPQSLPEAHGGNNVTVNSPPVRERCSKGGGQSNHQGKRRTECAQRVF